MDVQTQTLKFRSAIEAMKEKSTGLKMFPHGASSTVSDMLGNWLQERFQIESEHVSGWSPLVCHSWLVCFGWIVDITADAEIGNPPVIIAEESPFHRRMVVTTRRKPSLEGSIGERIDPDDYRATWNGLGKFDRKF